MDPNVLRMLGEPGMLKLPLPVPGPFRLVRDPLLLKSEPVPELSSSKKSKSAKARGAKRKTLAPAAALHPAKRLKTGGHIAGLKSMPFDDMG